MTKKSDIILENIPTGFIPTQTLMFIVKYAFDIEMPKYILWFPVLAMCSIMLLLFTLMLFFIIIGSWD